MKSGWVVALLAVLVSLPSFATGSAGLFRPGGFELESVLDTGVNADGGVAPAPTAVAESAALSSPATTANPSIETLLLANDSLARGDIEPAQTTDPSVAAYDPANGEIYVVDSGTWNVSVIDSATERLIGAVEVGPEPIAVAVNPVTNRVFVICAPGSSIQTAGLGGIYVIDGDRNVVTNFTNLNYSEWSGPGSSLTFDPVNGMMYLLGLHTFGAIGLNGTTGNPMANISLDRCLPNVSCTSSVAGAVDNSSGLLYVSMSNDTVEVVNVTSDQVVTVIPTGPDPVDIVCDSANGYVYVTDSGTNTVVVINGSSERILMSIAIGATPNGLSFSSRYKLLFAPDSLDEVSVISTVSDQVVVNLTIGSAPGAVGVDDEDGLAYVPEGDSDEVTVLTEAPLQAVGNIPLVYVPTTLAVSSWTGDVYVVDDFAPEVLVINGSSQHVRAAFPISFTPSALVFDPVTGLLFASDQTNDTVVSLNPNNLTFNDSISIGSAPGALAFNANDSRLFVALPDANSVAVVDPAQHKVLTTAPVGSDPVALALDSEIDTLYVANYGSDAVSAIGRGYEVTTIPVGSEPDAIAYDNRTGDVFVTNYAWLSPGVSNVTVIDADQDKSIASINIWPNPMGVTVDSAASEVIVTGGTAISGVPHGVASIINVSTWGVIAQLPVGLAPESLQYDSVDGHTFVSNTGWGSISILSDGLSLYPLIVQESGLSEGTEWSVNIGVQTVVTSHPEIVEVVPNGSYPIEVTRIAGWTFTPNSTVLSVNGSGVRLVLNWSEAVYALTFEERGLPNGTRWSVSVDGSTLSSSTMSASTIAPNGSYSYSLTPISGWVPTARTGSALVNGGPTLVVSVWTPFTYLVTFSESGLPYGDRWWVNASSSASVSSSVLTLSINAANGSHSYSVGAGNTSYSAPQGEFVVSAQALHLDLVFTRVTYTVTLTETGLPIGLHWTAQVVREQTTGLSPGNLTVANLTNGTYRYEVYGVGAYDPAPSEGTVVIHGPPAPISVRFSASSPGNSTGPNGVPKFPTTTEYLLIVGAGATFAGGAVFYAVRLRNRGSTEPPQPPGI